MNCLDQLKYLNKTNKIELHINLSYIYIYIYIYIYSLEGKNYFINLLRNIIVKLLYLNFVIVSLTFNWN